MKMLQMRISFFFFLMSGAAKSGILAKKANPTVAKPAAGGLSSLFKFYTDDTPGIKVGPTTVLVLSLIFMATVVIMHIVNKLHMVHASNSAANEGQEL